MSPDVRPGLWFLDIAPVRRPRSGWAGLLLLLAGSVLAGSCLNPHPDDGTNSVTGERGNQDNATALGPSAVAEQPRNPAATPAPQLPGGAANAGAPPTAVAPAPGARPMGEASADAGAAPDAGTPDAAIPANAL